jgi:hypothetical protein
MYFNELEPNLETLKRKKKKRPLPRLADANFKGIRQHSREAT